MFSSLIHTPTSSNESSFSAYDYLYETNENNYNGSFFAAPAAGPQHLAAILQQLFARMSDNQTFFRSYPNAQLSSSTSAYPSSFLSPEILLPSHSPEIAHSYRYLAFISLWFVLIINPIVILFGVIGNLLATYILIHCNIAKLPVSFYTIMLNISDTLNLLIPVLIFWLDNCFNRVPERGYFRDKSNFLCKALMCPDQLFAALSAWYMCAISFNRWYSVCRPSSYFFRTAAANSCNLAQAKTAASTISESTRKSKKDSSSSSSSTSRSTLGRLCDCYCFSQNMKFRQHLQAFRSIGCITLTGILCCLYPIFMHELRPVIASNQHSFDLRKKTSHTYAVIWKRCYYSRKHEYIYDIIGIILSSFLHILPLTFVAAMNIMIIIRLKQRQRLMTIASTYSHQSSLQSTKKRTTPMSSKRLAKTPSSISRKAESPQKETHSSSGFPTAALTGTLSPPITHKDQATLTDLPLLASTTPVHRPITPVKPTAARRHRSRDRTITIMLVSVALSYLILTIPYRLFWSYNVYIKRMHPEKLSSPAYLLKMHYIDHVLRTIRNIHYGTNFVFFIFLSKTFRRRFQQTFIEKYFQTKNRLFHRSSISYESQTETNTRPRRTNSKSPRKDATLKKKLLRDDRIIAVDYGSRSVFDEHPSLHIDPRMKDADEEFKMGIEMESNHSSRYQE